MIIIVLTRDGSCIFCLRDEYKEYKTPSEARRKAGCPLNTWKEFDSICSKAHIVHEVKTMDDFSFIPNFYNFHKLHTSGTFLLRWTQISARMSFGQILRTWRGERPIMIIVVIQQLPPYPALLLSCWSIWRRCSLSLSRWDCEEPWIGGGWKRGWTYFSTSLSTMNSLTLLSMSWYLAAARVMLWMMVVTWPKMEAYSREEVIIRKRQNSCKLLRINTRNMSF